MHTRHTQKHTLYVPLCTRMHALTQTGTVKVLFFFLSLFSLVCDSFSSSFCSSIFRPEHSSGYVLRWHERLLHSTSNECKHRPKCAYNTALRTQSRPASWPNGGKNVDQLSPLRNVRVEHILLLLLLHLQFFFLFVSSTYILLDVSSHAHKIRREKKNRSQINKANAFNIQVTSSRKSILIIFLAFTYSFLLWIMFIIVTLLLISFTKNSKKKTRTHIRIHPLLARFCCTSSSIW